MGFLVRAFVVVISLGVAVLIQNYRLMTRHVPAPEINLKEYWGPGSGANYKENTAIKPFDISVKPEIIEDLKAQLNRPLKLQDPLEGIAFQYGFNTKTLQKIVKYWRDTYLPKWSERENYLQRFPHFETQIQGLRIHFLRVKPNNTDGKKVLPLLLLHGWPGSVREFYDIIPLLTKSNPKSDYVFEVIAPSLVGYGWSQAAAKPGFGPVQMSIVMRNLMIRLGHEKFVIQGGDWGSLIGSSLSALFPQNVLGYHSNMCSSNMPISQFKMILIGLFNSWLIKEEHRDFHKPLAKQFSYLIEETGYMHLQATKPDTIGTALLHNPVGLLGYILEKFSTWTNSEFKHLEDGGLTKRYTMDALLDNIMIYYATDSIMTSQRLYSEAFGGKQMGIDSVGVKVPAGCARFKHDLMHSTDCQLKDKFTNLVHSSYHQDGGHFAAMELPQVLYDDFVEFMKKAYPKNINNNNGNQ